MFREKKNHFMFDKNLNIDIDNIALDCVIYVFNLHMCSVQFTYVFFSRGVARCTPT